MRLTALLASLAFVALAFAGCSDGGGDDDGTTTTTTSTSASRSATSSSSSASLSSSSSSSSTTTTTAPANQQPSGSISAAVNGTVVTFSLTGSDPDGDTLVWDLDFGDGTTEDGTTLPATVEHTYAAGNYTVNYTLTDGADPVTYDVAVSASAAGGAGGQSFAGSWSIGSVDIPLVAAMGGCDALDPLDGVFLAMFEVDPGTYGKAFEATITPTSPPETVVAWEVTFLDRDDDCATPQANYFDGSAPILGTVPDGVELAWLSSDGGVQVAGTYQTS